jgi:hypothetical protein
MRGMLRRLVILSICFLGAVASTQAWADPSLERPAKREAREHLDQGNRLYKSGQWADAIREYEAGAKIEAKPVFDYNLGQCARKRGDYQAALLYYDRFLAKGQPDGEVLAAVQAFMAEMRAQLANRAQSMPPSDPEPRSTERPAPITPARAVSVPLASPAAAGVVSQTVKHDEPSNWLGWTTIGMGVAAIGVSGYLFLRASSMSDAANSEPDTRARDELRDGATTRGVAGAVTGIAGIALTATGIVLIATQSHGQSRSASVGISSVGVSTHGVVVFGRF